MALGSALDRVARQRDTVGDVSVDVLAAGVAHHATNFGYAPGDRVVVVARADTRTEFVYDPNGQVTSKTVIRGADRTTWRYAWNARGELVRLTTPNGKEWTYATTARAAASRSAAPPRVCRERPATPGATSEWAPSSSPLKNDQLAETRHVASFEELPPRVREASALEPGAPFSRAGRTHDSRRRAPPPMSRRDAQGTSPPRESATGAPACG